MKSNAIVWAFFLMALQSFAQNDIAAISSVLDAWHKAAAEAAAQNVLGQLL